MHEFAINAVTPSLPASTAAGLFTWRGGGIVLIGTHEDGRWVLARGWLRNDRLEHVRRWTFAQPIRFSGQVRRLVTEANGGAAHARDEGQRALAWAETASA
ncbi:MAG: hypothetical protein KY456_02055 [Chloroflexi bacterium]|nr:hypothetical protein [Chloroflexota bacterium]